MVHVRIVLPTTKEPSMHSWAKPLRLFAYVVVILMAGAILYAAAITVTHWSGINV
jgi:hypothetical protein